MMDHLTNGSVRFEYEMDPGGLGRMAYAGHGIQKVGGSNPPGSTNFRIQIRLGYYHIPDIHTPV